MSDPLFYPIARERIRYGDFIKVSGTEAYLCDEVNANAVAVVPSYVGGAGDTHYQPGQTMRAQRIIKA